MVTAEIAVALPVVVVVLTAALAAVGAVSDQLRCVDAARTGARLLARGEDVSRVRLEVRRQAPEGADISLRVGPDEVEAAVAADLPALLAVLGVGARPRATSTAVPERSS